MTIRSTPPITQADIIAEFGANGATFRLSDYYRGGGLVPNSCAQVPASGEIGFFDFLGARKSTPGSKNFDVPGTYTWVVPAYSTMTANVAGGGGGGGESAYGWKWTGPAKSGVAGGLSRMSGVTAGGGSGGSRGFGNNFMNAAPVPTPGTATGGDENRPGEGASGGVGGIYPSFPHTAGAAGGAGGLAIKTWRGGVGDPVAGETITVIVGAGGAGGSNTLGGTAGTAGSHGYIHITWE